MGTPSEQEQPSIVYEWKDTSHSLAENIVGFVTGIVLAAFGLAMLRAIGAVTGGTAGLSLLLGQLTPLGFPVLFSLVNLPFAVLAVLQRGWAFTLRTALAIVCVSLMSAWNAAVLPLADFPPLYGVLLGNLICGVGLLVLFRHGASLGGFNIVALVLHDRTGFRAGWTLMIFDSCVVLLSLTVLDWPMVLLSALGALVLNLVIALNHRPGRYIGH
ncbi:YitT family protein [Naumannella halotolerans]|uniref:Putative 5xTM membrane YitT family protein n=1 Tax=Naumannella halotolerans TaxID=993414 RepID=A0A4R7J9J4_9ACTN|nr:YitT family protein [Naumannella halotolerans]TDT34015.1 putative 5xTM membrane YitT family protein [Naumannella halotolerans]